MSQSLNIRISVFPYVRKFLQAHYQEGAFNESDRSLINLIFLKLLSPMPKVDARSFVKPQRLDYGATFSFSIGKTIKSKYGTYVCGANVRRFNELILDMIRDEMYRFIKLACTMGINTDEAIRKFIAQYDFAEDELPFDNLKKWYYREVRRVSLRVVHLAGENNVVPLTLTYYEEKPLPTEMPAA